MIVFVNDAPAARLFADGQFQAPTGRAARADLVTQLRALLRAVENIR